MQHPTTRHTAAALTAAALTITGCTRHAAPVNPPAAGIAIGTAIALDNQCPGINQHLNNTTPGHTCPVMSPPLTVENQVPFIADRHPAYGWYPATCVLAGTRWDGFHDPHTGRAAGGINASARIVIDDGHCTGPTLPIPMTITTSPTWVSSEDATHDEHPQCRPGGTNQTGALALAVVSSACAPSTPNGALGVWGRGTYTLTVHISTSHGAWTIRGDHTVM